ncbi:MAG: M48 family metalloprotease [Kistimonas sp.]|nr:M48 family metalloprotease [Kistimonas sp.]
MSLFRYALPALLAIALTATSQASSLPSIGDTSSGIVSRQQEKELGQRFLLQLNRQSAREADPQLVDYTETLVARLTEVSQIPLPDLSIVLLNNPWLNAFAVPGSVVGIHTGLFHYADTEAEFAGVIAHELAHLRLRHYARSIESQQQQQLPTLAALLGSILLVASGAPDAGIAALSSTMAGSLDARISFTRTHEQEADRVGIQILADAGIDPRGMPRLFERMSKMEGTGPQYEFLRTHPLSSSRLADTRARAERYPAVNNSKRQLSYQLMQKRAMLLMSRTPEKVRDAFRSEVNTGRTRSLTASRYGLALAENTLKNPEAAEKALSPLTASDNRNISIQILHQQIQFALGKQQQALKSLQQLLALNPGNFPITTVIADLLQQDGQYKNAQTLFSRICKTRPRDPEAWYRLAEAAGLAKEPLATHTARAEYFFLTGNLAKARLQLERALAVPDTPFSRKEAINHRLREIRDMQTSPEYQG